ncbi:MAG: hypothetical protein JNM07_07695 [Phycisphaerae bacterium]|nr:hypothetical protein [Phycisphaerae bacterium]
MLRRSPIVCAAFATILALAASSRAGAQNTPEFEAWWKRLSAGKAAGPNVDHVKIHYRRTQYYEPPDLAELERLRALVKDKPEHPAREQVYEMERRLKDPSPDVGECVMWRLNGRWRWSTTGKDGAYDDSVWDRNHAFQLMPNHLRVLDPRRASRPGSPYQINLLEQTLMVDSSAFVDGGLTSWLASWPDTVFSRELNASGTRWKGVGTASGRRGALRVEASGTWDAAAGWGTIDRYTSRIVDAKGEVSLDEAIELSDWRFVPELQLGMAATSLEKNGDGFIKTRRELIEASGFTDAEFDALTAIPSADRPDPYRGPLPFTQVENFLGATPEVTDNTGAPIAPDAKLQEERTYQSRMRWAGWALGGLLLIGLIIAWRLRHARA